MPRHDPIGLQNVLHLSLPRGARVHSELGLVTWYPHGILDARLARSVVAFVEAEEETAFAPFHRFADLSGLDGIHLTLAEVEQLAAKRVGQYHGPPVKSAILAFNALAFGMAQMYEHLMRRSPIEVRVFCRLSSAATWLGMPIEVMAAA